MAPARTIETAACDVCETLRRGPLPTGNLQDLLAHVERAGCFELFGLPRSYRLDAAALAAAYLAISRNIHPDRFASGESAQQAFALRASAAVNRAHDTLKDPFARAEYLLESAGGQTAAQDKRVPPELLGRMMMLREELDEARAGGEASRVAAMRVQALDERRGLQAEVAAMCDRLCGGDEAVRDVLRLRLNSLKYVNNLLAAIDETT
jgi:molecular chaperone HscB